MRAKIYYGKNAHILMSLLLVVSFPFLSGLSRPAQQVPAIENRAGEVVSLRVISGEAFTLRRGQTAILSGEGLRITILEFYNSPCPENVTCIWSGVGIGFQYTLNGQTRKGVNLVQAFGFQTTILDTDHETYARLKITRIQPD